MNAVKRNVAVFLIVFGVALLLHIKELLLYATNLEQTLFLMTVAFVIIFGCGFGEALITGFISRRDFVTRA